MNRRTSLAVEGLESRTLLSSLASSLTTDQSVYQIGQPIQMTFTETNTTDQSVTVPAPQPAGFSIMHNGTLVLIDALPQIVVTGTQTFAPGQSVTIPQTWNGIPMAGPYTIANLTGTFVVEYGPGNDPTEYTTTFQIAAPSSDGLVTSVATDHSTYETGQPVNLTFTETNNGDQPVAVVVGSTDFQITRQDGTTVWSSPGIFSVQPTWLTLQPGQSYSQTGTWSGLLGTFTVSNLIDPDGSSATFQILCVPQTTQPNPNLPSPQPNPNLPSPPPIAVRLSTAHDTYKLGQSISISVVLSNDTASKVAARQGRGIEAVIVQEGSTVVYESTRKVRALASEVIKPGHALKLTALWSGKLNQSGVKKLTPGRYTITVDDDGYVGLTTVRIVSHRDG